MINNTRLNFSPLITSHSFIQRTFWLEDIEFFCQCDPALQASQFSYIEQYVPLAQGSSSLGRFHMRAVVDDNLFFSIDQLLAESKMEYSVEICDGVEYAVYPSGEGTWFRPLSDAQDESVGHYLVNKRRDGADILLHKNSHCPERYMLRAMREIMLRCYENADGFLFHASGVATKWGGMIFCGPSSAGKTTMMTLCLETQDVQLLANDRIIFTMVPTPRIIAVPMPVRVGFGTLEKTPLLASFIRRRNLSRPQNFRKLSGQATDFGSVKKIEFSPAEYVEAIGTKFTRSAKMSAIIFPKLTNDDTSVWYRNVPGRRAASLLKEACFTPHDQTWLKPWLVQRVYSNAELSRHADEICDILARSYPTIEIGFGVKRPLHEIKQHFTDKIGGLLT